MAKLRLRIDFETAGSLGPGKVALLEAIRRCGSISSAARELDMSYRRAWLLIDDLNQTFRQPVVSAGDLPAARHFSPGPLPPAHPWLPVQAPPKPPELPVEPRQYHEFLRTPRMLGLLAFAAALISVNWGVFIWGVNNDHVVETSLG